METRKLTAILAAIVLLTAAGAKAEISNTRTASCLVKVTCDPAILPLTFETIEYLMHSSGVAGRAASEVLGPRDEPYEYEVLLSIEPLSVMPTAPEFDDRPKPAARPPTRRSRPTRPRADDEEGEEDERALEEMRYFQATAKYKRKAYSQEEQEKEERRAQRRRIASPAPAKTVLRPTAALPSTTEQTLLFRLEIDLEDREVKPAAEEFMNALINNLRETLMAAHDEYSQKVNHDSAAAEGYRDWAREKLSELMEQAPEITARRVTKQYPADETVFEQLRQTVDLSGWSPEMSFGDALEQLKHSVDPPVKIVVLWADLAENAEIDQTTAINTDPISAIPVGKALELLLKSVGGMPAEVGYIVDNGAITIASVDALPTKFEIWCYDVPLAVDARELMQVITSTIEPDSWFETGGEGTIKIYQGQQLIVSQTREIQQQIRDFLAGARTSRNISSTSITQTDTPMEMLLERRDGLFRDKQKLELEIARYEAHLPALEGQIARIDGVVAEKVKSDPTAFEIQRLIDLNARELERAREALDNGKRVTGVDEVTEKLARAKIELAKRLEEVSNSAGGDRLRDLNMNLTDLVIDIAVSRAALEVVSRQLAETEEQLKTASAFDPEISQIRLAQEELEIAERQVTELRIRRANLWKPTVTVLGGI